MTGSAGSSEPQCIEGLNETNPTVSLWTSHLMLSDHWCTFVVVDVFVYSIAEVAKEETIRFFRVFIII